jgi:hypothetical protein
MYSLSDLPGSVRAQINAAGFPTKSVGWEFSVLDQNPVVDEIYKWIFFSKTAGAAQKQHR